MYLELLTRCPLTVFNFRRLSASGLLVCFTFTVLWVPDHRHHACALSWPKLRAGNSGNVEGGDNPLLRRFIREPARLGIFHWSDYGLWTTCTATCGTGVEGRRRACLNERSNEVAPENCNGHQREYRLCRIENCPNSFDLGYRAARCQEMAPFGQFWKPYYPSERDSYSPCVLACYSDHPQSQVRVVEQGVPSGTRCARFRNGVPETGVCVDGTCWSVGCDGYLNSTKYPDRCGVCGGDGSSCTLVLSEIISENLQVGYTDLIEVPIGATNIKISEIRSVRTYLALLNSDGDYLINGNFRVEPAFTKYFQAASSGIRYQRRNIFNGARWEEKETITARGPINETLHLQIFNLKDGSSNTLQYEYVLPIETSTQTATTTKNPFQSQVHRTDSAINIPKSHKVVDSLLETENIDPPIYPVNMSEMNHVNSTISEDSTVLHETQHSEENSRVFHNRTRIFSNHENVTRDSRIEENFHQTSSRTPKIMNITAQSMDEYTNSPGSTYSTGSMASTNSTRLHNGTLSRNATRSIGFRDPVHHRLVKPWDGVVDGTGDWSRKWPEIASLEGGDRATIVLEDDGLQPGSAWSKSDGVRDDAGEGLAYGPPYRTDNDNSPQTTTKELVTIDLQTEGPRHAGDVVLEVIVDQPVLDQHEGDNKLDYESQSPEDIADMSESDYENNFSSSDNENGLRYSTRATTTAVTPTTTYPTTTLLPAADQIQTETITLLSSEALDTTASPTTTEELITVVLTTEPPPMYFWRITGTMPCSATCGRGIIRNYAFCVDVDEEQVDDTKCDIDTKPDVIAKECTGKSCEPRWEVGSWSNCLGDCDSSYRFRTVHCWLMVSQGLDSSVPNERCNQTTKPNTTVPCEEHDCGPQWVVGEWGRCSKTCGEGRETRSVTCSEGNRCDETKRPENEQSCIVTPCVWATSSWSSCTGTCSLQSRRVFCIAESSNTRVQDNSCSGVEKPLSIKICGGNPCQPRWVPQAWGQCEGECGNSFHRRLVVCQGISRSNQLIIYPDSSCSLDPPGNSLRCAKPNCLQQQRNTALWIKSPWRPCSVTCGRGVQTRQVRCQDGNRLSDRCNAASRPSSSQECFKPSCNTPNISRNSGIYGQSCQDKKSADCDLLVQANLCRFPRYRNQCCRSCRNVSGRSASRSRN